MLSASLLENLRAAKRDLSQQLLFSPLRETRRMRPFGARSPAPTDNVVGVGLGERLSDGRPTGELAIKLFVRVKYPTDALDPSHLLPREHAGVLTDVEEIGLVRSLAMPEAGPGINPRSRLRPAQPGCSIGYHSPQDPPIAGTFGALVRDAAGLYILSNNHVLADENRLPAGSLILQPGVLDGGQPASDALAELTRCVPLASDTPNHVDCAIARVLRASDVSNEILWIGPPQGTKPATIDMVVHKYGRTSAYTVGRISSIDTDVKVGYETGEYTFLEQIIVQGTSTTIAFSRAGDSGSLIVERQSQAAVGLLFAGSTTHTIANPIEAVLAALAVHLA